MDKNDFEAQTAAGLKQCAKWLEENAGHLAHEFSGGCRDWSVEFKAGKDGYFPEVRVSVCKIDRDVLDAYFNAV